MPEALPPHSGDKRSRQSHSAKEVGFKLIAQLSVRDFFGKSRYCEASIVDQGMQRLASLFDQLSGLHDLIRIGYIERENLDVLEGAKLTCSRLQLLSPAKVAHGREYVPAAPG
jgi:hypothetical protein